MNMKSRNVTKNKIIKNLQDSNNKNDVDTLNISAPDILKERARLLALKPQNKIDHKKQLELVEFQIDEERYGIETKYIRKVHPLHDLTPLPSVPDFIIGIINVHGQIIPLIDIRRLFDLPKASITEHSKAIIIQGSETLFGILADEVFGVIYVAVDKLQASIPTLTGIRAAYLKGVTLEQLVVIDPIKLGQDKRILVGGP